MNQLYPQLVEAIFIVSQDYNNFNFIIDLHVIFYFKAIVQLKPEIQPTRSKCRSIFKKHCINSRPYHLKLQKQADHASRMPIQLLEDKRMSHDNCRWILRTTTYKCKSKYQLNSCQERAWFCSCSKHFEGLKILHNTWRNHAMKQSMWNQGQRPYYRTKS